MFRSRRPANRVVPVEVNACIPLVLWDELKAVIVDQHVGRPALQLIARDCRFDGPHGGHDGQLQTLLVHGTLNRDVRQRATHQPGRRDRRIELGVHLHLLDGAEALGQATHHDLGEELSELSTHSLDSRRGTTQG